MKHRFNKTPSKQGTGYAIYIPMSLIRKGYIDPDKELQITIEV